MPSSRALTMSCPAKSACSATETLKIDDGHNYDYDDIPDGKTNVV